MTDIDVLVLMTRLENFLDHLQESIADANEVLDANDRREGRREFIRASDRSNAGSLQVTVAQRPVLHPAAPRGASPRVASQRNVNFSSTVDIKER